MMLMGDEGDRMKMSISFGAAVKLEDLGFENAACVVADTVVAEIEGVDGWHDLLVEFGNRLKIGNALLDLAGLGRLREFFQQCQPIAVFTWFLSK
ncbi:MAG: hypothetical protein R3D03_12885 [Geminicoccaceae bacterium]